MGRQFLAAVRALRMLSPRHQIMALYAAGYWSDVKLEEETALSGDSRTVDLMMAGEPVAVAEPAAVSDLLPTNVVSLRRH